ncbi:chemotaxis protein CheB [Virgisporangium aliadipatigenens]|uniref:protein-glutamate methylesterase n=1 Tax=Virgisporangium aliadipatigenens TaxID=741659 RepID=A0A8J4DT60_9ACTN|nr:chemotaxis protein CheB [Virgisporangium aliadipatigenens]GIJ47922.1 chemotaxis protein CheB [Virgisporangium aliadipatigenens]
MAAHPPDAEPVAVARSSAVDPFPVQFPIVALVASAGGLDALIRVLAPLPADLPAAVLVALHQDPARPSQLRPILARNTRLPVEVAVDRAEIRPGRVLIIPPARHLLVTADARIGLIDTGAVPPARPSADLLLVTLAVICGRRALAVVLTGMGHDGQAGVRAVAHCGGTVLAQDRVTSKFYAMPSAAIATTNVQRVLALDDIAGAIVDHVMPS